MRLIFNELYIFSTEEKAARKIAFIDGINVITSSQKNGTDRGKSVIMRSLYHTLGADARFDAKWNVKDKIFILKFSIDSTQYFMYRAADMFKFFDANKKLLFATTSRHELATQLSKYTNFSVELPNRDNKLEVTSPAFNYLLFFLDQDHYDNTKFSSFSNLGQYQDYKENVLYYHLGVYDPNYFEFIRQKEQLSDKKSSKEKRNSLLSEMKDDIQQKIGGRSFAANLEILNSEISLHRNKYTDLLTSLNKCADKLCTLRNQQIEAETSLSELSKMSQKTEKEIVRLREHRCPECNSILQETLMLQSKRYNLIEDIVLLKNSLQHTLLDIERKISDQEKRYTALSAELAILEEKMKINTIQVKDFLKYKGFCEIRDSIIIEQVQLNDDISKIKALLAGVQKRLLQYRDKKASVNQQYCALLTSARTKFGLNEIDPDSFKSITKNFSASGSNKPIATVVWYLTLIKLRKEFNPYAIDFPVVFDSPNNTETDDIKRHQLLQYILDELDPSGQLILSSIGFEIDSFKSQTPINLITLKNQKYQLLRKSTFDRYYPLLCELCDAE